MYAIAGVTGHTGAGIAENLLAQGKKVRVIVREAEKGAKWKAKGAEVAVASLDDSNALAGALRGVEGAYLLLPPNLTSTDMVKDNAARVQTIGRAIAAAKVPHVVFLSSAGAQHAEGTGPIKTLHRAEVELPKLAPSTRFTWLRPGFFLENTDVATAETQGILVALFDPEKAAPMVATADIARIGAKALVEGPRDGRASILEIAGPREVSSADLARELSALLGKHIEVVHVPREGLQGALEQAGLGSDLARLYAEMSIAFETGHADYERNGARFERGTVEPREVLATLRTARA
jgi:uncharacterized protein YbjT (DUF2867 family)